MPLPHPQLIKWLEDASFTQVKDKPLLFMRKLDQCDDFGNNLIAWVDFRKRESGERAFSSEKDIAEWIREPEIVNKIEILKAFKDARDSLPNNKLVDYPKKQGENKPSVKSEPIPAIVEPRQPLITQDVIQDAIKIAKVLEKVVVDTKMFKTITGKWYVYVDGWETLGAMMHCRSEITSVMEYKTGFMAFASIYDANGNTLSKGSAICTRTEKNWKDRDEYAIYSMAQTRALGKAYRLGLSWVMSLAGLETVPAEEVD